MRRFWSFRASFSGLLLGLLTGGLIVFVDFMTPPAVPTSAGSGSTGSNPNLAGFGGLGGPDFGGAGSSANFGSSTPATQLASLELELNGTDSAIEILQKYESDPRERLSAVSRFLAGGGQRSDQIISIVDGVKEQLDAGWNVEIERAWSYSSSPPGSATKLVQAGWELDRCREAVDTHMQLTRLYVQLKKPEKARDVVEKSSDVLSRYHTALREYNRAAHEAHQVVEEDESIQSMAVWPMALSVFGFLATGIARPILDALGTGITQRAGRKSSKQETENS